MTQKTCIIISGPTAVGKTAIAIQIASHYATQIISADSRQCYKELNIGVAKPSLAQLSEVPHHFINVYSVIEEVNAKMFEKYALKTAATLFESKDVIVVAGGTGLYLKAFAEGLDDMPPIEPSVQKLVHEKYAEEGLPWLQEEIRKVDPEYTKKGELFNPHRLIRALIVRLSTGKSIIDFQTKEKVTRPFQIVKIGLELPKGKLHKNINDRVEQMIQEGLENEVRSVQSFKNLKALQTVGYTEVFDYIDGKTTRGKAIELIKLNTRHYAKRQMTWFRKDADIKWFDASNASGPIQEYLKPQVKI